MKQNVDSRHIWPYSTQSRVVSLYDRRDTGLIEILYRIMLYRKLIENRIYTSNRWIDRFYVPPFVIKHPRTWELPKIIVLLLWWEILIHRKNLFRMDIKSIILVRYSPSNLIYIILVVYYVWRHQNFKLYDIYVIEYNYEVGGIVMLNTYMIILQTLSYKL